MDEACTSPETWGDVTLTQAQVRAGVTRDGSAEKKLRARRFALIGTTRRKACRRDTLCSVVGLGRGRGDERSLSWDVMDNLSLPCTMIISSFLPHFSSFWAVDVPRRATTRTKVPFAVNEQGPSVLMAAPSAVRRSAGPLGNHVMSQSPQFCAKTYGVTSVAVATYAPPYFSKINNRSRHATDGGEKLTFAVEGPRTLVTGDNAARAVSHPSRSFSFFSTVPAQRGRATTTCPGSAREHVGERRNTRRYNAGAFYATAPSYGCGTPTRYRCVVMQRREPQLGMRPRLDSSARNFGRARCLPFSQQRSYFSIAHSSPPACRSTMRRN